MSLSSLKKYLSSQKITIEIMNHNKFLMNLAIKKCKECENLIIKISEKFLIHLWRGI